jgi:hypothetical protein
MKKEMRESLKDSRELEINNISFYIRENNSYKD